VVKGAGKKLIYDGDGGNTAFDRNLIALISFAEL